MTYGSPNNHTGNTKSVYGMNYTAAFHGCPNTQNMSAYGFGDPALDRATYIYTNYRGIASTFYNGNMDPYDVM